MFFDTIGIRIKGDVMKFSEKSIKQTKNIVENEETKEDLDYQEKILQEIENLRLRMQYITISTRRD